MTLHPGEEITKVIPLDLLFVLPKERRNVNIDYKEPSSGNWVSVLINAIPFVLLLAFWLFMMRQIHCCFSSTILRQRRLQYGLGFPQGCG